MTRNQLIEALAEYYNLKLTKDEKGRYDIGTYYWVSGCEKNGKWFSLDAIVEALEPLCDD